MPAGRRLVGAKSILRYLAQRHGVVICRQTLHKLRTAPEREFSCGEIEAGATKFPSETQFDGLIVKVVADTAEVDAWIARHRRQPVAE